MIETCHDANGIVWPMTLAPYEVLLAAGQGHRSGRRGGHRAALYDEFDGRPASTSCWTIATFAPGVKFKDADLVGIPLRVVIGKHSLKEGKLEMKWRWAQAGRDDRPGRIGVGTAALFRPPLPPNRTGGFPASGSPVDGITCMRIERNERGLHTG